MANNANNYSDQDRSTNLLITLKHMKAEFNTFSQESSNESLYQEIDSLYQDISALQRSVFEMMCAQSWYKMKSDSASNIKTAYDKAHKSESELA